MALPTIHVIDFEGNRRYGIIEFGVATLQDGEIINIESHLCAIDKTRAFSLLGHSRFKESDEVYGSSEEVEIKSLAEQLPFSEYFKLFSDLRRTGYFCAHHAPTEDRLLRLYAPCSLGGNGASWGPWIDTLRLFRNHFRRIEDYQRISDYSVRGLIHAFGLQQELDFCVNERFREVSQQFHRAGYDALATALLLKYFAKSFHISSIEFLLK